jgi:hypothetical protein
VGKIYIRGHGFGMAKPSGFKPIAIPNVTKFPAFM